MPSLLYVINEGCAFLLELALLAILGWWGATRWASVPLSVVTAAAVPCAAALVWGLFAAPKAKIRLPLVGILAVKALVFGAASAALWSLERPRWATAFAAAAFVNTAIAVLGRTNSSAQPG